MAMIDRSQSTVCQTTTLLLAARLMMTANVTDAYAGQATRSAHCLRGMETDLQSALQKMWRWAETSCSVGACRQRIGAESRLKAFAEHRLLPVDAPIGR